MRKHITKTERERVEEEIRGSNAVRLGGSKEGKSLSPPSNVPHFAQAYRATGEGPRTKMKRWKDER